jgi:hypothetical protein
VVLAVFRVVSRKAWTSRVVSKFSETTRGQYRRAGPNTPRRSKFEVRMIPIATVLVLFTMFAALVWALAR